MNSPALPHRIGLTGGIGSGKSSVAAIFASLGVPTLDLDRVGHQLCQPGSECLQALSDAFGDAILHADGSLNRRHLAAHCFKDAAATRQLNAIMHPRIAAAEDNWLRRQQAPFVIIEASVLLESGGEARMDSVICVLAELALRRQRVVQRGDRSAADFDAIVQRQCSDQLRRAKADYIITNNGDPSTLQQSVTQLYQQLQQRYPGH